MIVNSINCFNIILQELRYHLTILRYSIVSLMINIHTVYFTKLLKKVNTNANGIFITGSN